MKINLLRDDQTPKSQAQKKENDILSFDDTSGGNDDFYFEQPAPRGGRYRHERRFSFGWFIFLVIFIGLIIIIISNPTGTRDFLSRIAHRLARAPKEVSETVKTVNNDDRKPIKEYVATKPVQNNNQNTTAKQVYKPVQSSNTTTAKTKSTPKPVQEIIRVEKPVYKKVVKESTKEVVLKNPPVYEKIRDDIATTKRNLFAAEYAWSKVPGGVTMEEMTIDKDVLRIVLTSRAAELINSYPNVMSQHDMFLMIVPNDAEIKGELTRVYMYSELPGFDPADRPEQLWDLKVEWLDDYVKLAAPDADVLVTPLIKGSEVLEGEILVHNVNVKVIGNRTAMMVFLHDIQDIPATVAVKGLSAKYDEEKQNYIMNLDLLSYERK